MAFPPGHIFWGFACATVIPYARQTSSPKMIWGVVGIIVACLLPDIDWVPGFWLSSLEMESVRHGFTHGILFAVSASIPFWYYINGGKGIRYYFSWVCLIWGHGVLDCFYSDPGAVQGVALFSPFSTKRFYFPLISSVELESVFSLVKDPEVIFFMTVEGVLLFLFFMATWLFIRVFRADMRWKGIKVNPLKLILFRVYNVSIGRTMLGDKLLRILLLKKLGLKQEQVHESPYCQSSDYFTYDQIKE